MICESSELRACHLDHSGIPQVLSCLTDNVLSVKHEIISHKILRFSSFELFKGRKLCGFWTHGKVTCTLVNYETCEIAAVESFTVFLMAAEIFLMGLKETL